jgi:hypothetical protein
MSNDVFRLGIRSLSGIQNALSSDIGDVVLLISQSVDVLARRLQAEVLEQGTPGSVVTGYDPRPEIRMG